MIHLTHRAIGLSILAVLACPVAARTQDADELAKQLSNPVSSLISLPFQNNFDVGAGPGDEGVSYTLNIQPVIPFVLSPEWTLIVRTIVPITHHEDVFPDDPTGLGDTLQSFFFSPATGLEGFTLGFGPALMYPTGHTKEIGSGKWGAGPTLVAVQQTGPWTFGILTNHIWSYAGDEGRDDVSRTFIQPFVSYAVGNGLTLSLNTESSYDWKADQWTVPIIAGFSQVFTLGGQHMSFGLSGKYFAEKPEFGPEWGIRAQLTLLFPSE